MGNNCVSIPEYCWDPPAHMPKVWLDRMGKDLAQDVNGPPSIPPGSPPTTGVQAEVFGWILSKTADLVCRLDEAVEQRNEGDYVAVRDEYRLFVKNLDYREAPAQGIKWVYIMPTIRDGTIQGVTVVVEWNPSSSSSTIKKK